LSQVISISYLASVTFVINFISQVVGSFLYTLYETAFITASQLRIDLVFIFTNFKFFTVSSTIPVHTLNAHVLAAFIAFTVIDLAALFSVLCPKSSLKFISIAYTQASVGAFILPVYFPSDVSSNFVTVSLITASTSFKPLVASTSTDISVSASSSHSGLIAIEFILGAFDSVDIFTSVDSQIVFPSASSTTAFNILSPDSRPVTCISKVPESLEVVSNVFLSLRVTFTL
jgi:hypothetical protein